LHAQSLKNIENVHEWQNTIVSKYFKQIMRHFLAHLCSIKSEHKFQFTTWWILLLLSMYSWFMMSYTMWFGFTWKKLNYTKQ
jgi:hypothetical protein